MADTAYERLRDRLVQVTGYTGRERGDQLTTRCPAHEDRNPSLSLRRIEGQTLIWCHGGCDWTDVLAALDLTAADLYDERRGATYRYESGRVVHRSPDKHFRQSGDTSTVELYHLSRLREAGPGVVYLVEGEKDVHSIEAAGGVATTAPMGAANFGKVDVEPLRGRHVAVVVDQDEAGAKWAAEVATRLEGVAAGVRYFRARAGKDAADHIAAGHGLDDLIAAGPQPEPSRFASTLIRRSGLSCLPPVEPLIEGVLSLRTAGVLFGPTGAGKTVLALGWACCVGTGADWLGHEVVRAPVLYVVGEGAAGLDRRVAAWEYAWQTKVADDDVLFSVKPDSLSDRTVWTELTAEALTLGARFVVLDTFSSLAPDADETKDAPTFTRRLSDLAEAIDGTALAVHHPGWSDADRTRGGYQLEANVDEVLKLAGNATSDLVELSRKKVKEGPSGWATWLRRRQVELGRDNDGLPYGSVVMETASRSEVGAQSTATAETVVREVFAGQRVSKAVIRDALIERAGLSRTVAYETIGRLVAAGVLRRAAGTDERPIYEVTRP